MSSRRTDRWGFSLLGPGDGISDDGFKFSDADIRLIDRILKYAAESHHHTGGAGVDNTPVTPPNLYLHTTGGAMPSGVRYYYKFTVIDTDDNESAASPAGYVDTPSPLQEPQAPVLNWMSGVGTLQPGTYTYVLSAYKGSSTLETKATQSAVVTILGASTTNEVILTMPTLPPGADGFNIYRKTPSGLHFLYLASTVSPTWTDTGGIAGDCDRSLPAENRSNKTNSVTVTYPGATPTLPAGWKWRIYRTDDPTDWDHSYLTELAPFGSPAHTAVSYDDIGASTGVGAPPTTSQILGAPDPIVLTDVAEVTGYLPPGRNVVPMQVSFVASGVLTAHTGDFIWTCDYEEADIISCRAYLGVGRSPASQDVIVDVNALRPGEATPSWQSIYAEDQSTMPRVIIGETIGLPKVPAIKHLVAGDSLCIDIDQAGGGATPTDYDLTVNILMYVRLGSISTSYTWLT